MQIGVAGQALASELGWFDECSWLLWQICNVATLPGDSFALATSWRLAVSVQHGQVGNFKVLDLLDIAWQQVANLQCSAAWAGWQV